MRSRRRSAAPRWWANTPTKCWDDEKGGIVTTTADIHWDPYDSATFEDPHPTYRRLRDEAPLYRNDEHGFYAVSRFADVERVLVDRETHLSRFGNILDQMKSGRPLPPGTLIFEEPPVHTARRALLSRVFTPKHMYELDGRIREFCRNRLDLVDGTGGFDFVADLGAQVPMRVIAMLLGIPESDQESVRDHYHESMHQPRDRVADSFPDGEMFASYVDWRRDHPSDDLMSTLLQAEFEDETGATRRLTRQEILTYVTVLAGAGNETTNLLIGWMGMLFGDHPDQRRAVVGDRSLVRNAVEEVLRYESIAHIIGRTTSRDVELHGEVVPAGSIVLTLPAAGNRDERAFPDPDRFDVARSMGHHLAFGYGAHFCLGAALARTEARVVLEEVLDRFPDWEVDHAAATMLPPGPNRGWATMPVVTA
jgi:cytochrome P450